MKYEMYHLYKISPQGEHFISESRCSVGLPLASKSFLVGQYYGGNEEISFFRLLSSYDFSFYGYSIFDNKFFNSRKINIVETFRFKRKFPSIKEIRSIERDKLDWGKILSSDYLRDFIFDVSYEHNSKRTLETMSFIESELVSLIPKLESLEKKTPSDLIKKKVKQNDLKNINYIIYASDPLNEDIEYYLESFSKLLQGNETRTE